MSNRQIMACTLNGVDFSGLDEKLYIEDITEKVSISMETDKRPGHGRAPLNSPAHETLQITIRFMVKEFNGAARASVVAAVQAWACAGWLTVAHRPLQRIFVYPTSFPDFSAWQRTNRMEITFTALGEACWQDISPVTVSSSGSSQTLTITPTGTETCYLEAEITPSDTLSSVSITVNGRTLTLSGMSIAADKTVRIHYDEDHRICIDSDGVSLLEYRTGTSADDLLLVPKTANTITAVFNVSCSCAFMARGMWR